MNTTIKNKLIWLTIGVLALAAILIGCATTPQGKAYQSLKDTQTLVDKGMTFYGQQCRAGKVSVEKQAVIDQAHTKYRLAFREAVNLARLDYSKLTPETVQTLANTLLDLITKL